MKTFKTQAAQGDILICRIDELPSDIKQQVAVQNQHIVAHSETGHHHAIPSVYADFYHSVTNAMITFLVIKKASELKHHRAFDTHESIQLDKGIYEIRRQREYTPEGWRRIED